MPKSSYRQSTSLLGRLDMIEVQIQANLWCVILYSGKIWRGFQFGNSAIQKKITKLNSVNIKPHGAGWLSSQVPNTVLVLKDTSILPRCREFLSLSEQEIHVANESMGQTGRGKPWPYMLQGGLTSIQSKALIASTHWRRERRWEVMAPKMARPRLLNTSLSLCFQMAS